VLGDANNQDLWVVIDDIKLRNIASWR